MLAAPYRASLSNQSASADNAAALGRNHGCFEPDARIAAAAQSAFWLSRAGSRRRRASPTSTRARASTSTSATASAAATTSMPAISRGTWASTSPAIRPSCRRTWTAPAPAARQLALQRRRRRTAPRSASSAAAPASTRCSAIRRAQFDATKFNWIGSANNEVSVCVAWHTTGVTKFEDMLAKALIVGGTGARADTDQFPQDHQRRARHQDARSSPAIPAATTSAWRWSAARCRAAAAGHGRA